MDQNNMQYSPSEYKFIVRLKPYFVRCLEGLRITSQCQQNLNNQFISIPTGIKVPEKFKNNPRFPFEIERFYRFRPACLDLHARGYHHGRFTLNDYLNHDYILKNDYNQMNHLTEIILDFWTYQFRTISCSIDDILDCRYINRNELMSDKDFCKFLVDHICAQIDIEMILRFTFSESYNSKCFEYDSKQTTTGIFNFTQISDHVPVNKQIPFSEDLRTLFRHLGYYYFTVENTFEDLQIPLEPIHMRNFNKFFTNTDINIDDYVYIFLIADWKEDKEQLVNKIKDLLLIENEDQTSYEHWTGIYKVDIPKSFNDMQTFESMIKLFFHDEIKQREIKIRKASKLRETYIEYNDILVEEYTGKTLGEIYL